MKIKSVQQNRVAPVNNEWINHDKNVNFFFEISVSLVEESLMYILSERIWMFSHVLNDLYENVE